ncbi:class I SAM-dependent methyltransferase [Sandaracinus amylolyticus]|uniref:class I SAM-dependent methyltransferase n=1 Tax=Sandaracinus amylolyticus TaxID=927083 RepID=UPI001F18D9C4|nr:class I SAM-dependent methyltransferase [Sandaracinus amylolyticus]UJR86002.1 Hypothetical protein I5071_80830 [Sandaracinus amylolyticus]
MTPDELARALRRGCPVDDDEFDRLLIERYRCVAARYFTPIAVAARAAHVLESYGVRTVLDVGSGVGKLCIVAALGSDLELTGIEQRAPMVLESRRLAARFGVSHRARFERGTIEAIDLAAFDALYVFNSFAENVFPVSERLDATVELSATRMARDLAIVERALERMPLAGSLLTYHGFGGEIPDTFDCVHEETAGTDVLRLWSKRRTRPGGARWIEVGDEWMLCDESAAVRARALARTRFEIVVREQDEG